MRSKNKYRRDTSRIANRRLPDFDHRFLDLREIQDRRRFHPEGRWSPAVSIFGASALELRPSRNSIRRHGVVSRPSAYQAPVVPDSVVKMAFSDPRVTICVRREQRREVLHALKKAGKGGGRPPRLNWTSKISCKRRK